MNTQLHWLLFVVACILLIALGGLAWSAWDMRNVDLTPNKE